MSISLCFLSLVICLKVINSFIHQVIKHRHVRRWRAIRGAPINSIGNVWANNSTLHMLKLSCYTEFVLLYKMVFIGQGMSLSFACNICRTTIKTKTKHPPPPHKKPTKTKTVLTTKEFLIHFDERSWFVVFVFLWLFKKIYN